MIPQPTPCTQRQQLALLTSVAVVAMLSLGCSKAGENTKVGETPGRSTLPCKPVTPLLGKSPPIFEACMPKQPPAVGESQSLHTAIVHCDLEELRGALSSGIDANGLVQDKHNVVLPLHYAIRRRCAKNPEFRIAAARALIDAGAAVHLEERNALELAIEERDPEVLEVLMEDQKRLLCHDRYGSSPVERALRSWQRQRKRAKQYPNAPSAKLTQAALDRMQGLLLSPKIIKSVIAKLSPLRLVLFAAASDRETLTVLQAHGVDLNRLGVAGGRSLAHHAALSRDGESSLETLAAAGVDLSATDSAGVTPLMLAALHGKADPVNTLLQNGANVTAVTDNGWSALSFAGAGGHDAIASLLQKAGGKDPLAIQSPPPNQPMRRLMGEPCMRALDAITEYEGNEHAHLEQMEGHRIVNRGQIRFHVDASVGDFNKVLESRDARILNMLPETAMVDVSIPKQPEGVDADAVKKHFESFAAVEDYMADRTVNFGPTYVDYESCPEIAKRVIDTERIEHSKIASCTSDPIQAQGKDPVEHVIIRHGVGMDCPAGCIFDRVEVFVDAKGQMAEAPRRPLRAGSSEMDLAMLSLRLWYFTRKMSVKPELPDVLRTIHRLECEDHGVPDFATALVKREQEYAWRLELSRNYRCTMMGSLRQYGSEVKTLHFEIRGALIVLGYQQGGQLVSDVDGLVVRERPDN